MIAAYLVVAAVLAMAGGYIAIIHYLLNRAERHDLDALARKEKENDPAEPRSRFAHPDLCHGA
jgi:cbb3-type cytochrome oxidase subunit 3